MKIKTSRYKYVQITRFSFRLCNTMANEEKKFDITINWLLETTTTTTKQYNTIEVAMNRPIR